MRVINNIGVKNIIINEVFRFGLNEKRRNPETNVDESFVDFFRRLLDKYNISDIFVSFRRDAYVSDINPNNEYKTPTGFYTYPLISYWGEVYDGITENKFRGVFPYQSKLEYIYFFIVQNKTGLLDRNTSKSVLDEYTKKIIEKYGSNNKVKEICENFINNKYISKYESIKHKHNTHLFWLLLYDVSKYLTNPNTLEVNRKTVTKINNICNEIGVIGFADYDGDGYINTSEPKQAVFFRVKGIGVITFFKSNNNPPDDFSFLNKLPNNKKDETIIKILQKYNSGIESPQLHDLILLSNDKRLIIETAKKLGIYMYGNVFAQLIIEEKYNTEIIDIIFPYIKEILCFPHLLENIITKTEHNRKEVLKKLENIIINQLSYGNYLNIINVWKRENDIDIYEILPDKILKKIMEDDNLFFQLLKNTDNIDDFLIKFNINLNDLPKNQLFRYLLDSPNFKFSEHNMLTIRNTITKNDINEFFRWFYVNIDMFTDLGSKDNGFLNLISFIGSDKLGELIDDILIKLFIALYNKSKYSYNILYDNINNKRKNEIDLNNIIATISTIFKYYFHDILFGLYFLENKNFNEFINSLLKFTGNGVIKIRISDLTKYDLLNFKSHLLKTKPNHIYVNIIESLLKE